MDCCWDFLLMLMLLLHFALLHKDWSAFFVSSCCKELSFVVIFFYICSLYCFRLADHSLSFFFFFFRFLLRLSGGGSLVRDGHGRFIFGYFYFLNQKIPRFVDYFLNEQKTPFIALKTGDNITEIGMKGKRLKKNWKAFILQHQLQHNDVLIFIPESMTVFPVLIFDSKGDEKIFPLVPCISYPLL
ncbi:unnamed protein product [Coffea canephora]|uniref:TF-B3 domain-containing protein n=1 Tax=Coffea canephora TaxID=49390 RepID=A0A068V7M1_COFCA|nr:unnamed protein product [Coffea canephora]